MSRPKNKDELLQASSDLYQKLTTLFNQLSLEQMQGSFCFDDRDKNIRDVIIHLYEWHQLLLKWVNANQLGMKQSFLPKPYNWKTYQKLNIEFFNKHQKTSLDYAMKLINQSHVDVIAMINLFSNDQLFTKKYYDWTGTTSLGSYCVSATSSHYVWAINKIKKYIKMCLT